MRKILLTDRCNDIPDFIISLIRNYADHTTICPSLSSKSDLFYKIKMATGLETELQSPKNCYDLDSTENFFH